MKSNQTNRFAVCLLAVLSLFVSSVPACCCAPHHQKIVETETPACHEHAAETKAERQHGGISSTEIVPAVSESECVCRQSAPKFIAKSENVKVEKHTTAISFVKPPEIVFTAPRATEEIDFSKPFYLTDSFHNLSPGRAPPRL